MRKGALEALLRAHEDGDLIAHLSELLHHDLYLWVFRRASSQRDALAHTAKRSHLGVAGLSLGEQAERVAIDRDQSEVDILDPIFCREHLRQLLLFASAQEVYSFLLLNVSKLNHMRQLYSVFDTLELWRR